MQARISQGRPATFASIILVQVMRANQKTLPPAPAAAATPPTRAAITTASLGSSTRARALESHKVRLADPTLLLRQPKIFSF